MASTKLLAASVNQYHKVHFLCWAIICILHSDRVSPQQPIKEHIVLVVLGDEVEWEILSDNAAPW